MPQKTADKYIEAIGRRKTATARVRITAAKNTTVTVNDQTAEEYFSTDELLKVVHDPFTKGKVDETFSISVHVSGGGVSAQAEAIRHGITRAIVKHDESYRPQVKKLGFLKRDPRSKERRKAGKAQKARKRKQWSKR